MTRSVKLSGAVSARLFELSDYLTDELQLSREAAMQRVDRLHAFLAGLSAPADYELCRFKAWRKLGYHCAPFENWVFAYEIFDEGIIIRDMSHAKLLKK
jgi:hypothetical protein